MNKAYKEHDFSRVWRYLPWVPRPLKELVKWFLFNSFPKHFSTWAAYQHWKQAQIFRPKPFFPFYYLIGQGKFRPEFQPSSKSSRQQPVNDNPSGLLAVAIHAFYPGILKEMLLQLRRSENKLMLYVSTIDQHATQVEKHLKDLTCPWQVFPMKNRGRDILPFFHMAPHIISKGHPLILKLHTKQSKHLKKRNGWHDDLCLKLIGEEQPDRALALFKQHPDIGMIGPEGHILPVHLYYGSNAARLEAISQSLGVHPDQLKGLAFVAGSMFYLRSSVLEPLLSLGLGNSDFEPENDQKDGTMAHVLERAFPLGLILTGQHLVDTKSRPGKPGLKITHNHPYSN